MIISAGSAILIISVWSAIIIISAESVILIISAGSAIMIISAGSAIMIISAGSAILSAGKPFHPQTCQQLPPNSLTNGAVLAKALTKAYFFVRMRQYSLTSDTIDVLCLVYSNFCTKKIIFKICERTFTNFRHN